MCPAIAEHHAKAWQLTIKGNSVAVVSDGSAVLGLGNIGPKAAMPVMEGKAICFRGWLRHETRGRPFPKRQGFRSGWRRSALSNGLYSFRDLLVDLGIQPL
jgi:hypothetical protein